MPNALMSKPVLLQPFRKEKMDRSLPEETGPGEML
jgi:hypothetical protein